ncbi:MAG: sulfotransferase [Pseudomonadota bacterium]|nr:sulfotransferase [Pseudomonadota bacterium]
MTAPSLESARTRIAARPTLYPNVLGIGAAKAGTTTLSALLAAHPQVCLPAQKELNVLRHGNCLERLGEYEDFFAEAGQRPVRLDYSVSYLSSEQATVMASALLPEARLIVMLRNPVDQVQSHYWHLRRQNFHQWNAVDVAPELPEALDRYPGLLVEPALYGKHLQRWLSCFGRDRLHVMRFESFRNARTRSLDDLAAFLGIDPFPVDAAVTDGAGRQGRAGVQPRSAGAERIYNRLYSMAARGPYQWLKAGLGVAFAESLKRRLRLREAAESLFFREGYEMAGPELRATILGRFRNDIGLLEEVTGESFDTWREA